MRIIKKEKNEIIQKAKIKYETFEEKLRIILYIVTLSLEYNIKDRIKDSKGGYLYIECMTTVKLTEKEIEKWYDEIKGGE